MINRENPQISSYIERYVIPPDEEFYFVKNGFYFAFGVEGYHDGLPRDDPRYVKMFLRHFGKKDNGEEYEELLPYRKCNAGDYANMVYSIPSSRAWVEQYRTDPKKSLNCIDWETVGNDIVIWGSSESKNSY